MESIDTVLGSIFTICQLTEPLKHKSNSNSSAPLPEGIIRSYSLKEAPFLPIHISASLNELIASLQESLESEFRVLLENHRPDSDFRSVYKLYESILNQSYMDKKNVFDLPTEDEELLDSILSFEETIDSFKLEYDFASFSSASPLDTEIASTKFNFQELCNEPSFKLMDGDPDNKTSRTSARRESHSESQKKRKMISKEAKALLESVFRVKTSLNSKERKILADKCNLSPMQVRVWFTNKRARNKESIASNESDDH
ncbi:hypothetical protein CANARDRAFT_245777 [[Candida] arabinofermentans NRRL YB-2248]|uniref:Homeobox domain-containing protein n=1 Tax=[Candida] arabinofermentans NRRL YB-2248 TaxID=983967 RepID=A0A1E4ST93_9ASCO|nr:hypothetical protein CANARDRAFT_245777 [[Candida] arabinofermentans NRRL YB-2248]